MKPPFAYAGGKTRLAERIVSLLPEHAHYVEPFAGSLAVLLAKPQSPGETVNDIDGDIMCFWKVLRERPDELMRVCALTPHSRLELQHARDDRQPPDELERARRTFVRISQARGGTLRTTTGWRFYAGLDVRGATMPATLASYVERMAPAAERLAQVSLECDDYAAVLARYDHPDTLFYLDPPYLGTTRSAGHYAIEMRSAGEHREFLQNITAVEGMVVLSGYASELYDTALTGWERVTFPAKTQNGSAVEVLWFNPAAAARQPHPTLALGGA